MRTAWGRTVMVARLFQRIHERPVNMRHAVINVCLWGTTALGTALALLLLEGNIGFFAALFTAIDLLMLYCSFVGLLYRIECNRERKAFEAIALNFKY